MTTIDTSGGVVIPVWSLPTQRYVVDPAYVVLDEYTNATIDAKIADRRDPWADSWRALRTVPADWRRSVWAAAHARAFRISTTWAPGFPHREAMQHFVARPGVTMESALHEAVADFHMGHRPPRLESRLSDEPEVPSQKVAEPSRYPV